MQPTARRALLCALVQRHSPAGRACWLEILQIAGDDAPRLAEVAQGGHEALMDWLEAWAERHPQAWSRLQGAFEALAAAPASPVGHRVRRVREVVRGAARLTLQTRMPQTRAATSATAPPPNRGA